MASRNAAFVATVGSLRVEPGASNVIPGRVVFSLDVRHEDARLRRRVVDLIFYKRVVPRLDYEQDTIPMNPDVTSILESSLPSPPHHFPSGAGHDAAILAPLIPSAMLFIRSPGGISHHPHESVIPEDVELALAAMVNFVRRLASGKS
jgi:allantoate deiminase